VLIVGSNYYKPGEHDYLAAAGVLHDLLKQSPGVAPVVAVDWPTKPETLANSKAVVFFFDGAEKHQAILKDHAAQLQKLLDAKCGLTQFHQTADYPKDFGDRARSWSGAAWEKGMSQRAHWVAEFKDFPAHPIFNGVNSFKIDDGWLWNLHYVNDAKTITPLLRTTNPKATAKPKSDLETVISWTYQRADGGRSFTFTGGHLHASFAQEGYRRFLVNGILWSAGLAVPETGAPVMLQEKSLDKYLTAKPAK
jgi:type 1 glutamine amidotransferase